MTSSTTNLNPFYRNLSNSSMNSYRSFLSTMESSLKRTWVRQESKILSKMLWNSKKRTFFSKKMGTLKSLSRSCESFEQSLYHLCKVCKSNKLKGLKTLCKIGLDTFLSNLKIYDLHWNSFKKRFRREIAGNLKNLSKIINRRSRLFNNLDSLREKSRLKMKK